MLLTDVSECALNLREGGLCVGVLAEEVAKLGLDLNQVDGTELELLQDSLRLGAHRRVRLRSCRCHPHFRAFKHCSNF